MSSIPNYLVKSQLENVIPYSSYPCIACSSIKTTPNSTRYPYHSRNAVQKKLYYRQNFISMPILKFTTRNENSN